MANTGSEHGLLEGFLPHGTCIAWDVPLLSIYVFTDFITSIAYLAVPFGILYFLFSQKKEKKERLKPIYYLFAATFLACGLNHFMGIITIWFPLYYIEGAIKLMTAITSVLAISYVIMKSSAVIKCVEIVGFPDLQDLLNLNKTLQDNNSRLSEVEIQLRKSQQELAESNHLLKAVLDTIPGGVFWKDLNLNYLGANAIALWDSGAGSATELIGKNDFDLKWKEFAQDYQTDDREVLASQKPKLNVVDRYVTPEGHQGWAITNKVPLLNNKDELIGVLGTYNDITDMKEMEIELREAKEFAEEASKAKSKFLSRMSHELRTPLNGILGFSQLLLVDELSDDQKENTEMIQSAGQHLLSLVNEVLELESIENGKMQINIEPVEVSTLITQEVVPVIQSQIETHQLSLEIDIPDNVWVNADVLRLKQLLFNLLSNAIKYNTEKGVVRIVVKAEADTAKLIISDTGKGIAQEDISTIFEPFKRLDRTSLDVEGTGIGLAISKEIARLMNSELSVESVLEQGSTFWFELNISEH